jgi:hypothetical protein
MLYVGKPGVSEVVIARRFATHYCLSKLGVVGSSGNSMTMDRMTGMPVLDA